MENFFDWLLGLNEETLTVWQVAVRGLLVYASSLVLVRVAGKRFFGEHTAFDVVLGIILGSVMSRAINGSAPFWGTVIGGLTLVLLHLILATVTFYYSKLSLVVKGQSDQLIDEGHVLDKALRHNRIGQNDLLAALRKNGHTSDFSRLKAVYMERDGSISVIPAKREPQVIDIEVHEGVQIVRIEMQ